MSAQEDNCVWRVGKIQNATLGFGGDVTRLAAGDQFILGARAADQKRDRPLK